MICVICDRPHRWCHSLENVELADESHKNGEPPEDSEHGQTQVFGAAQTADQVSDVEHWQWPYLRATKIRTNRILMTNLLLFSQIFDYFD